MLIRAEGEDSVLAIGQASHAWISGQLARAWGNERFGEVTPWEEVCLGAEQHDIGWALWDTRPSLNPDTGLPHTFIDAPLETKLELWSAAPRRMLAQCRYAALLVSMHGSALYDRGRSHNPGEAEREGEVVPGPDEPLVAPDELAVGVKGLEHALLELLLLLEEAALQLCLARILGQAALVESAAVHGHEQRGVAALGEHAPRRRRPELELGLERRIDEGVR